MVCLCTKVSNIFLVVGTACKILSLLTPLHNLLPTKTKMLAVNNHEVATEVIKVFTIPTAKSKQTINRRESKSYCHIITSKLYCNPYTARKRKQRSYCHIITSKLHYNVDKDIIMHFAVHLFAYMFQFRVSSINNGINTCLINWDTVITYPVVRSV